MLDNRQWVDVVVVGSGVAGLYYAFSLMQQRPDLRVLILSKGHIDECNTSKAQGGIAVVLDRVEDTEAQHIQDTLKAGDGLCDEEVVAFVVHEGPDRIKDLIRIGASFDVDAAGRPHLGKEGGHSSNRILHAKDQTGLEIHKSLLRAVQEAKNVSISTQSMVNELIVEEGVCKGLSYFDQSDTLIHVLAGVTVIATGGIGQLYGTTTNPTIATGDGVAMASRAGVKTQDMAFVQFHPTALFEKGVTPSFLISEAVRGAGAILRNQREEAFMTNYDPLGSLATRDIVSRAIFSELAKDSSEHVWLDVRHLDMNEFETHFPTIYAKCHSLGLDLSSDMIPVAPASHYACGGVKTDHVGCSSMPNLMCIGEAARTGMHGANRLASNSLLEALVYGKRAADHTAKRTFIANDISIDYKSASPKKSMVLKTKRSIQTLMVESAGVIRSRDRLKRAQAQLRRMKPSSPATNKEELELSNMIEVASLIISDSLKQKENRGVFYLQ